MRFTAESLRAHEKENAPISRIKSTLHFYRLWRYVKNNCIKYAAKRGRDSIDFYLDYNGGTYRKIFPKRRVSYFEWWSILIPMLTEELDKRGFSTDIKGTYYTISWKGEQESC